MTMNAPKTKSLATPRNGGWPQFQDTASVVIMAGSIGLSANIICFSQTLRAQWQAIVEGMSCRELVLLDATTLSMSEIGRYLAAHTTEMTVFSGPKAAMMAQLWTPAAVEALVATVSSGTVVVA